MSMHWTQLVDHWLWPSMVQSNWWQLLLRVQSALLVWVGDHNHGLCIYIFGNLCTSVYQRDCKAWDDCNIGSMSHITFSHQDVSSFGGTIWGYQLPLIQASQFSNWVEWDISYNRWCHWSRHPAVSKYSHLDILLVEQAVICLAAAIHECGNSTDSHPDVGCQISWDDTQYIPKPCCCKDQSILDQRSCFVFLFVRNLCRLYEFPPLNILSRSD